MRQSKLPLIVLGILLLAGAAIGAWFVANSAKAPDFSHNSDVAADAGPQDTSGPDSPAGNRASSTNSNSSPANNSRQPGNGTSPDRPDHPQPESDPNPKPDRPIPGSTWKEQSANFTITGKVRFKSDSRPAAGASVSAQEAERNPWWGGDTEAQDDAEATQPPPMRFSGTTTTNGAGEFSLSVIIHWYVREDSDRDAESWNPRLTYQVLARLTGYAPARSQQYWVGAPGPHVVELELAIPAAVTGRIIDGATRTGIAGAQGSLWDVDGAAGRGFTTDKDGYFSINDMAAGIYVLNVFATGYNQYNGWQSSGRIDLTRGGETNLGDIQMSRSSSVIGRVVSPQGEPMAGVSVRLETKGGGWMRGRGNSSSTDENGKFEIHDVQSGTYSLLARKEGAGIATLEEVNVETGAQRDLGDITLEKGLVLTGIVVNARNEGVAGAKVSIHQQGERNPFAGRMRGEPLSSTTTGKEGKFEIVAMIEGEFYADVTADGYAALEHDFVFPIDNLKLTLRRGGSVAGKVVDGAGVSVDSAMVMLMNHNSPGYAFFKAAPGGSFGGFGGGRELSAPTKDGAWLIENVPAGTYVAIATAGEGEFGWVDDLVVDDETRTQAGAIKLGGKGRVRVTVTEDGQPVADLEVGLSRGFNMGRREFKANSDQNGVALLEQVPAGAWSVMTSRDDRTFDTDAMKKRMVNVKPDETVEFHLELRPKDGVRLHGRLTMNGKATISELFLVGVGERESIIKNTRCNEGYYEYLSVTPGTYMLHARAGDDAISALVRLELKEPGEVEFTRDFQGLVVSGRVITPENSAAQNSAVTITLQHSSPDAGNVAQFLVGRATCDSEGRFRIESVCAGTYMLTASLPGVGNARLALVVENSDRTGLSLSIDDNVGSVRARVAKLVGTPVSGNSFAFARLIDAQGQPVSMPDQNAGMFMVSEGATVELPNISPGTYTVEIQASGFLPARKSGVTVTKGARADADLELTAAAELHLTCTNPEITQAMLDAASVRYLDATGKEVPAISNVFDAFGGGGTMPDRPTLKVGYIGPSVVDIRVKLAGYAELSVPVQFAAGKKITQEATFVGE
ncbi:MAG: carboxypeptidase regulatory-like domain-containing protein [Planctomycetes bacterium]|nr:carboxypeptidase regulatory-like domain-containing protein [Planctomycetota bacterium]